MSIDSSISAEAMAILKSAAERAARGVRDMAAAKAACERMDRRREELRDRIGTVEVAVELIRATRDE